MKRRILSIALIFSIIFLLAGCGNSEKKSNENTSNAETATEEQVDNSIYPHTDPDTKLVGYINSKKEWVIEPQFQIGGFFDEDLGVAVAGERSSVGIINKQGEWVIPASYSHVDTKIDNGYIILDSFVGNSHYYKIADKDGNIIYDFEHKEIMSISKNGLVSISSYGYYSLDGEEKINVRWGSRFNDAGYATARSNVKVNNVWTDRYGFIDESGIWLVEPKYEDTTSPNKNGYASVKVDGGHSIINILTGEVQDKKFYEIYTFSDEGYAIAKESADTKLSGIINEKGEWVVEPKYSYVSSISPDGIIGVKENDKYGFIDTKGNYVIEPRFDDIKLNGNPCFIVVEDGKQGLVNSKGKIVVEPF